jgi:hypothetical protein
MSYADITVTTRSSQVYEFEDGLGFNKETFLALSLADAVRQFRAQNPQTVGRAVVDAHSLKSVA